MKKPPKLQTVKELAAISDLNFDQLLDTMGFQEIFKPVEGLQIEKIKYEKIKKSKKSSKRTK